MSGDKTKPTTASVAAYLSACACAQQRADTKQLMALLAKITGQRPKMWGPGIGDYGALTTAGHEPHARAARARSKAASNSSFLIGLLM